MYMNAFVSKGLGLCTGIQMSLSPLFETPGLQMCVCLCWSVWVDLMWGSHTDSLCSHQWSTKASRVLNGALVTLKPSTWRHQPSGEKRPGAQRHVLRHDDAGVRELPSDHNYYYATRICKKNRKLHLLSNKCKTSLLFAVLAANIILVTFLRHVCLSDKIF